MPSTRVPFRITSASISMARNDAALSVVKNGFPVPAPKMTTRPFSRWRMARRRISGSAMAFISMALCNRVSTPMCSSALCKAMALIIVANMPM